MHKACQIQTKPKPDEMSKHRQKHKIWIIFGVFVIALFYAQFNAWAATFVENFNTAIYKDATNTSADWELETSSGHLINGDWRKANNTKVGGSYEITPAAAVRYDFVSGPDNNPIILYTNFAQFLSIKWNNAGEDVCGVGITACWSNISGTNTSPDSVIAESGMSIEKVKAVKKLDGYPAVIAIVANRIYYTEYIEGFGWMNSDGQTEGFELISDSSAISDNESFLFKLDPYGEPSLLWYEKTGTGPYTTKIRYARLVNRVWKYADRTTSGKETIFQNTTIDYNQRIPDFDYFGNSIYIAASMSHTYAWKWDGSNWRNLDGTQFATVPGGISDLTYFQICSKPKIAVTSNNVPFVACASSSSSVKIAQRLDSAWKYVNGTTAGIETLTNLTYNYFIDFGIDRNDGVMVWMISDTSDSVHTVAEIYFTQWKNGAWKQADGVTAGWEAVSNVADGGILYAVYNSATASRVAPAYALDENNYPIFAFMNTMGGSQAYPGYVSRYTGNDFKGGDKITNDQDAVFPVLNSQLWYPVIYFNPENKEIFVMGYNSTGTLVFSKFNNNVYPQLNQNLVSQTIATAHENSSITSATLTVNDDKPSGTAITYYLSANGGTNWEPVTPGEAYNFTNTGADLRWKANLTSSAETSSPSINYFYIDVDAKTANTSADVIVSASVDPTLSLALPSSTCDFDPFSATLIKTCNYNILISTNSSGGYVAYVRAADDFKSGSNSLFNVSDGFVTAGTEEYGIATSDSDYASLQINKLVSNCASYNDLTNPMPATNITTSDKSFAMAEGPVLDDSTDLCHAVAISGTTKAGNYTQIMTITAVGMY